MEIGVYQDLKFLLHVKQLCFLSPFQTIFRGKCSYLEDQAPELPEL